MATRIRYSTDGTVVYDYTASNNTKLAVSSDGILRMDGDNITSDAYGKGGYDTSIIFNFPATINVSKVRIKATGNMTLTVMYCNDTLDGLSNTDNTGSAVWVSASNQNSTAYTANEYKEVTFDVIGTSWLRIRMQIDGGIDINCVHLFGNYDTPSFKFIGTGDTIDLGTTDYIIPFSCSNRVVNDIDHSFRIYNQSGSTKIYTATVVPVRYSGDQVVVDHVLLSYNGGGLLPSITTDAVSDASASLPIDINVSLPLAHLVDGYHYFAVEVDESFV